MRLDRLGELDLQPPRQVEVVLGLHDVGDAALAGLRVHPDHGLVGPPDVVRVDRQVGGLPGDLPHADALSGRSPLQVLQALLDRVLVAAGERRVDQVARVRVARVDRQVGAVLHDATDLVDLGEVDLGVDALGEQVHAQGHQVDVAGALAMTEQAALHPVGAGHQSELGGRGRRAAVVVRVQRDRDVLTVADVPAEPLDLVGVDVGRGHLDRRRQVQDDLPAIRRFPDVHHGVADLDGELQLGAGEDLRGVLVAELDPAQVLLGVLHHQLGAPGRQRDALGPVHAEHDPPEQWCGGVVHVDGRGLGSDQRLRRPLDQILAGLGEHRDGHVIGDPALNQLADEVEVVLAGRRETDLDLLVTHPDQQVEHLVLAGRRHGIDQRLVAVPQVGGQPARSIGDPVGRPGSVGQINRWKSPIAREGHRAGLLHRYGL